MATITEFKIGTLGQETGYEWTIASDDFMAGKATYRTNSKCEGLYIWSDNTQNWVQCLGNAQFSLSADPKKAKKQILANLSRHA